MNDSTDQSNPYLLVDGALAKSVVDELWDGCSPPRWLHCLYSGEGALAGPLLIDLEMAVADQQIPDVMVLAHAIHPQVHLSFVEALLPVEELIRHFRLFTVVRNDDGQLFNLRFSDCLVLSMLEAVLTPSQWASFATPFSRWCVHTREGGIRRLQGISPEENPITPPLTLSAIQVNRFAELSAPDVMLAHIRDMRHGEPLNGSADEQHRWATQSRRLWRDAGNENPLILRWITQAAVNSKGAVLSNMSLIALLGGGDREQIRRELADQL
jgi:hypothetical protein